MVATRGGARTGADDKTNVPLGKKPVRKAAAKPKPATTTTRAKTTRAKTVEPELDLEQEDTEDELQREPEPLPVPTAKPGRKAKVAVAAEKPPTQTRKPTTRVKKDEEPSKSVPKAQPKITKGKAKTAPEEAKAPALAPPGKSRATRATRATAAKDKAAPLSPKKNTQVSKPPAKTSLATDVKKAVGKAAQVKSASKGRPALRKRHISDENAGVSETNVTLDSEDEIVVSVKGSKSKAASKPVAKTTALDDDPADETSEESQDELQVDETGEVDSEVEQDSAQVSFDEICGPKTPMKRSSPRETMKYTSAQKSVTSFSVSMRTPVKRFAVLGTQQGTPQTQKPYCKPSVPVSDIGPMTVARARDRAMVFPRLEPLPDLNIDETDLENSDSLDSLQENDEPFGESLDFEDSTMLDVEDCDSLANMPDPVRNNVGDVAHEEVFLSSTESLEQSDDSNATVVVTQNDSVEYDPEPEISFNDQNDDEEDSRLSLTSTAPETLIWGNIQPELTIPFEFETDLSASRSLMLPANPTERLSIVPSDVFETEADAVEGATLDVEMEPPTEETNLVVPLQQRISGSTRESLDATMNFSELIDVKSLAESPQKRTSSTDTSIEVEIHQSTPAGSTQASTPNDARISDHDPSHEDQHMVDRTMTEEGARPDESTDLRTMNPVTPTKETSEHGIAPQNWNQPIATASETPRYAMSTIASRRKSITAFIARTSVPANSRPQTSDGASVPRIASTLVWSPLGVRPSTVHRMASTVIIPIMTTPTAKTPGTSVPLNTKQTTLKKTPIARKLFVGTPKTSVTESASTVVRERFPGLPPSDTYEELQTPAKLVSPTRTPRTMRSVLRERKVARSTPMSVRPKLPKRNPVVPSPQQYEVDAVLGAQISDEDAPETPQSATQERFPGLPYRRTYEEHAKTAAPVSRFRTPVKVPTKRPATAKKPASLRKAALMASHTPNVTPLRATAATPGQELMTPHPAAPLRGVVALVEVYTSDGGCATPAFTSLLQRLGAKTTKTFSERITHLVFKEGPPNMLQRLRLHNKQVLSTGIGIEIACVNSRWVTDCDALGKQVDESDEVYVVDAGDVPGSAKRRRKSMEPTSLINLGGNVVRDRKSSLGRSSLGRSPMKIGTPQESTPKIDIAEKENSGDDGSPATPAYLAAPDSLVQQTAPMNRVKKLDFNTKDQVKNRRLTFWDGGEF